MSEGTIVTSYNNGVVTAGLYEAPNPSHPNRSDGEWEGVPSVQMIGVDFISGTTNDLQDDDDGPQQFGFWLEPDAAVALGRRLLALAHEAGAVIGE